MLRKEKLCLMIDACFAVKLNLCIICSLNVQLPNKFG
jgi:hypothetical protein